MCGASSCSRLLWGQRSKRPLAAALFALCWPPADTAESGDASGLYLAGSGPLQEEEVWKVHSFSTPRRRHSAKRTEKLKKSEAEYQINKSWVYRPGHLEEILPLIQNEG